MELKDYLRVIRLRWFAIAALTLIGLALASAYTFLETPLYQAKTQLFVSVKAGSSASELFQGNAFAEKRITSYVSLATSARVLEAVAQELNLSGGAQALVGKVSASSPTGTVLIDITATDPDPQQAVRIANTSVKQLITAVYAVEDASLMSLSVFEEATPPSSPSSPNVPVNLVLGAFLGLLLGLGYVFLREVLDTKNLKPT